MKKLALFLSLFPLSLYPATTHQQLHNLFNAHSITSLSQSLQKAVNPENGHSYNPALISFNELHAQLQLFALNQKKQLGNATQWMSNQSPFTSDSFNLKGPDFKPFAQKVTLPAGSKVLFFGDLHGNIHSLMRIFTHLKEQKIIDDEFRIMDLNYHFIFLGDYVDRGNYGAEVIFSLLRLKNKNPHNVFMVRGNHEDADLNTHFGFAQELKSKFGGLSTQQLNQIYSVYDLLPQVLYLGITNGATIDFIQSCHGGMELGYNPNQFLSSAAQFESITQLARSDEFQTLPRTLKDAINKQIPKNEIVNFVPINPTTPSTIGFMWSDFIEDPNNYSNKVVSFTPGRGWVYGYELTRRLLDQASSATAHLRGVFRAHQHHTGMLELLRKEKGIVSLWDGMVHTFLSVPVYRINFPYDAFGILHISDSYEASQLEQVVL